jgi:hypothetical protein
MMTDQTIPPAAKNWAAVADNALHYLAGAAICTAVGFFAWYGKVSTDLFVVTITGAAGAVGFKMTK